MVIKFIKNTLIEIPLYCIASFVVGAYTVLLINFFYFDNHITPPGVSALVACMGLLFTIYAAFKVKAWSENKRNDKGFSQTEKLLEALTQIYIVKNRLFTPIANVRLMDREIGHAEILNSIDRSISIMTEISELVAEAHSSSISLELWGVKINSEFENNLNKLDACIRNLTFSIISMKDFTNRPNPQLLKDSGKNAHKLLGEIDMIFKDIFQNKHHGLFDFKNSNY